MRTKIFAFSSSIIFIISFIYFNHVLTSIYEPGVKVSYYSVIPYTITHVFLSALLALGIWLFKKRDYINYFYKSLSGFFLAGVILNLIAVYLMFWSKNH